MEQVVKDFLKVNWFKRKYCFYIFRIYEIYSLQLCSIIDNIIILAE
jgi:hypothetical protein